jgi:hypothetical protein
MALYDELDSMFPWSHSHYYLVNLSDMNEALEKCARITSGGSPHVITYNGQLILISPSAISPDILWLTEIVGPAAIEGPATVEETPEE